jgi:tetratricopeptide (TPR) repeat protein
MWAWEGPNQKSRNALNQIDPKNGWYLYMWFWQEAAEGNYEAALQHMSDTSSVWAVMNKAWARPKSLYSAFIYQHLEKNNLARMNYEKAASILEKRVSKVPDDPRYHSSLGLSYAGLGLKEKAKEEAAIAISLLTVSDDAIYGSIAPLDAAIIYIMTGEMDLAMKQMEHLLSFPNYMSVVWIEWDFRLAPLKTHPGYQSLLLNYSVAQ